MKIHIPKNKLRYSEVLKHKDKRDKLDEPIMFNVFLINSGQRSDPEGEFDIVQTVECLEGGREDG